MPGRGAREVAPDDKITPLADVIAPLGEVTKVVMEQVRSAVKTPDEIKLELGAALKGKSSIVLVSGESEATIKVTLSWQRFPHPESKK